jgi:hypothetical protein
MAVAQMAMENSKLNVDGINKERMGVVIRLFLEFC